MKRNVLKVVSGWSVAIALALGLAGCGGGSGGGATGTPAATTVNAVPFKSVFLGMSTGRTDDFPTLAGSDDKGHTWSGAYDLVADGATVFEGKNVTKSQSILSAQMAGGVSINTTTTRYFLSDGSVYKILFSTGVSYVPSSQAPIPDTVKVGDTGTFGVFTGSDGTVLTYTWSLNPGTNGSSILAISTVVKSGSTVTLNEVDSIYLDAKGNPTHVSAVTTGSGVTVTMSGDKK